MTVLSTVEFEVTWGLLELGELPLVLDLPSAGRTRRERAAIVDRVVDDLRGRGLAGPRGPEPDLVHQLTTLARFSWAVDSRIITDTRTRARGAVATRRGVLAVLTGDRVTIDDVPEHTVVPRLAALAGDATSSRVESVSVRADALDTAAAVAGDDLRALSDGLITLGERVVDARTVARVCTGIRARGQFSARQTDRSGRQHSAPRVVGFHDTPTGRYLQLRRDGWVTFTPVTGTQLLAQVHQLLDEADPQEGTAVMTTGDYTIDSAIARLEALTDGADRQARALSGQLAGINQEAAQQTFTAGAPNSSVTATVTGAGKLVGITISGVDRRRPRTEQLSADLTATILAARSKAAAAVGERLKKVVPGFFEE